MDAAALDFYASPGPMTRLPAHPALDALPADVDGMRAVVQGLLVHRDWAPAYGLSPEQVRIDEQQLRSTVELLTRAFELDDRAVTEPRDPERRVLTICRHFAVVHAAFLRSRGVPARARCGFASYFEPGKWFDHWITERWVDDGAGGSGGRWVRDDPQVDALQAEIVHLDLDPYDQPAGAFLTGAEAWIAGRAGDVDPDAFGIFDMWGLGYISGNVITDLAALDKVELLPWDDWGVMRDPHAPLSDEFTAHVDALAALVVTDDVAAIRARADADDLRVPPDITSFVDGTPRPVHLDL